MGEGEEAGAATIASESEPTAETRLFPLEGDQLGSTPVDF